MKHDLKKVSGTTPWLLTVAAALAAVCCEAALEPVVKIDGAWLDAKGAAARGLLLGEVGNDGVRRVALENRSGAAVRPEELGWRKVGRDDFDVAGLKAYCESWTMASPCGVRNWDDEPFDYSPGYLHNCVSTPGDFHPGEKGRFLSDCMIALRRPDGKMRLWGFTTGKDRFGHFDVKLAKDGVALFHALCACDRAVLAPQERIETESLVILDGNDTEELFNRFAARWGRDSDARHRFAPPVGWCSWYYYFSKVTLGDVIENADWFAAHRAEGYDKVKVIQLDDGYQAALGDWLVPNEKFPGGLARYAKEVKSRGFTPAVWVGPFMVEENSVLAKEHPDWLVKGADGQPASPLGWRDNHRVFVLDGTNPAVQDHLETLFRALRGMGIDYVKLDFCMIASSVKDARYFDPSATRAQALRRGFEAIRRGFGEDGFILGCTAPFGPLVGIVDAMRSSTDITPYWDRRESGHVYAEAPTVPNVCRNVISHTYLNGRVWINDPDTLIVRDDSTKLTLSEVELWAEAIALTGGSLLLSDRFKTLSAARRPLVEEVLRRVNTNPSAVPFDRWERTYPAVWASLQDGRRVKTLFNFEDAPRTIEGREVPAHSALRVGAKGTWVVEAGIRKFQVGRSPADAEAEAKAAYARPVGGKVWRFDETTTLDEINELPFAPGDTVLFKRGGVWRGQLQPRSGVPGHPVTYGAWGAGEKPVIEPSYSRVKPSDWREVSPGVWRTETGASADIGNVIFEKRGGGVLAPAGKSDSASTVGGRSDSAAAGTPPPRCVCGFKRNRPEQLKGDLDFWCDPKTFAVSLKSAANPATRGFGAIELCEKVHGVDEKRMHDVVYDGLHVRYSAAHGFGGDETKRLTIRNCDISWIGGGFLYFDKFGNGVRYGNGIEFWSNAEGHVVESNRVWECWDAGLTNQSNGDGVRQCDIVWRGNEVWNCEYSFEYWQQGAKSVTERVHVVGNRFRDSGFGWAHAQRWNANGAHLMFYDTTAATKDFLVKDNVFSRSRDTLMRFFNDWRADLTVADNRWISSGEPLLRYHGRPKDGLKYRYPDRLDVTHDDNVAEIESQGTGARVFKADELPALKAFFAR